MSDTENLKKLQAQKDAEQFKIINEIFFERFMKMIEDDYSPGYTVFTGIEIDPNFDKKGLIEYIDGL